MYKATYIFLIVIAIVPTVPGIVGVVISSLSFIPPVGLLNLSLSGYEQALQWPGLTTSILLTTFSALASTYIALILCFMVLQTVWQSKHWRKIENLLSPLLAIPHVAFAIGFAFIFASTGISARLISTLPFIENNSFSSSWLVHDQYAIGLTIALALKELPFLLFMSIPILQQLNIEKLSKAASALGYSPQQMWLKVILPQWLNKMRFPLFAVVAYGAAVVDVALVLGPTTPSTLAVLVWQWFSEPNLTLLPRAAAGAMILFFITGLLLLTIVAIEKWLLNYHKTWQYSGRFGLHLPGTVIILILTVINLSLIPIMIVWSIAQRWRFPDILPSYFSTRFWLNELDSLLLTIHQSVTIAFVTASISTILALLAHEYRLRHKIHIPNSIIALPMLVPQLSLLFGLQISTLYISGNSYYLWVIWAHIFFAFPLVYLTLDGPWRSYNNNYSKAALSLGKKPIQVFFQVKAKILIQPIFYAWAIGASVSLAQYLPTLILGGGRITTITTEAVALSSGFDRRVTAIYALWQTILPFIFFSLAIILPRFSRPKARFISKTYKEHPINDAKTRKPRHL